ncbi:MAG: hypothetical protein DVB31_13790 [Verrucomicrobia bacterium]|nr:MAG: hypothetical protein DVB31_13790 [Verrucomicrobiota bacterium]
MRSKNWSGVAIASMVATVACLGLRAANGVGFPAAQRVWFETGFEPFEGYDTALDLGGQNGWVALGNGGNGILPGPLAGFDGQVAYVGFVAPNPADDLLNVFRPVALMPVSGDLPLITFTVSFEIFDSTEAAPYFDDFRWSAYNTREERLFTLDFDNSALEVNFALDDAKGFVATGFKFSPNEVYDLRITLNFARNLWTADINGAVVVNGRPITTKGSKLDLNEIDAVWAIRDPAKPGNNFMVFDDYRITVLPVREIPSSVEWVGQLANGTGIVRVLGEPGVQYVLEASGDLRVWHEMGSSLAQFPGGIAEFQDPGAGSANARFYRAHGAP